ncbi:MAG TPA: hypothetical protein VGE92_03600, partial [Steroidobacteraceae bacterium]
VPIISLRVSVFSANSFPEFFILSPYKLLTVVIVIAPCTLESSPNAYARLIVARIVPLTAGSAPSTYGVRRSVYWYVGVSGAWTTW